ncbi:unnamed protein product [Sphagnum jensenii]|uniref:AP2/ERF domain-containing protein n=1 Tax=Sphagnum jensenii TaxID=128206 RepID=A0ABP1BWD2_9BRYO
MCLVLPFHIAWSSSGILGTIVLVVSRSSTPDFLVLQIMDSDLNMVPNVDSGMQEDHVQATSAAAAAPEPHGRTAVPTYVGPARLYFGQIPADLVEEAGTVVASFQQLQLDDHGGESDSPASNDVGAQAAEVAAVLQQPDAPAEKKRKLSYRCGSPSKSSEFLGVTHYQRTGRWEAHIWVDDVEPHKQLYLGASATAEEAARAYDKAALVLRGEGFQDRINFKPAQQYEDDVKRLKLLTNDQMALFLRGDSKGTGAVWTYPYVRKIKHGIFEATYAENWKRRSPVEELLGSYSTLEEAARAVYDKAVQENNKDLAQSIKDISIVRTLPTTAQRAAIDAGLPVPSAQKTVTRRRRKQKAPRKPYTPRKKKLDVVAGAAAANEGHDQTLQQVLIHIALCRLRLFGMFLHSSRTSSSRQCLISSGRADGFLES